MRLIISQPVVDLLSEPGFLPTNDYSHHDARQSQLLFNDEVEVIEEKNEWLFVFVPSQLCFRERLGWHPYRGWIHKSEAIEWDAGRNPSLSREGQGQDKKSVEKSLTVEESPRYQGGVHQSQPSAPTHVVSTKISHLQELNISFGTLLSVHHDQVILPTGKKITAPLSSLRPLNAPFNRRQLIQDAALFLDDPYLWGGTAAFGSGKTASLDCSGLIYLLYRAQGIFLPRDAHDQWLKSKPVSKDELLAGDLLFLAREDRPNRISHVLLFCGDDVFMEAPQTNEKIRRFLMADHLSFEENFIRLKGREKRYFPHFRRYSFD